MKKIKKHKKIKFDKEKISSQIENIGILTCIAIFLFLTVSYTGTVQENTRVFYLAYHNIDLTFNIQRVVGAINGANLYTQNGSQVYVPFESLNDTGSDFVERNLQDYYIPSMNSIDQSYSLSMKAVNKYLIWALLDLFALGILLGRKL